MPKKKHRSIARLVEDAAEILQRIVRLKAADENGHCQCVTCKKWDHWSAMQGGHYISRVKTRHKLLEENIHPQCPGCNGPRRGEHQKYTLYMIDTYGREFVEELIATQNDTMKWRRVEILDHIEALKEYEKEIRSAAGF